MVKIFFFASLLFLSAESRAQSTTYVSSLDRDLSISSWTLFPLVDNLGGIYSKPIQEELKALLESEPNFRYQDPANTKAKAPEEFEENSKLSAQMIKDSKVDAFLAGRISKGPAGMNIRLALFSGQEGLPLLIESATNLPTTETRELAAQTRALYQKLKSKLPYRGVILSRRGQNVTFNLGSESGLKEGQDIESVQVINVQRHPRFHFLVQSEKEIMGKIKITKVDKKLSFGSIISERAAGQLKPGSKISFDEFTTYATPGSLQDGTLAPGELGERPDSDVAFGKNPKEWTPMPPPTFGKVALLFGLGSYSISNNLSSSGSVSGRNSLTPSFHVEGEMWLSAQWFMELELHQYVTQVSNGLTGSSPGSLQVQTLETELMGGYNILASEEFWGPKMQLLAGLTQMDSKIDDSTPTALTSNKYGGMALGIAGSLPMGQQVGFPLTLGGKFLYNFNTSLSEAPKTSGSSSSSNISTFSLFGEWQKTERLAFKGELSFRQYNTTLSGSGSRAESASAIGHSMMTLAGGAVFLF